MKPYATMKNFLLGLLAGAILFAANVFAQPREIFVLSIGTDGDDFEDDSGISASSGEVNGNILVYINGNPVLNYASGGVFKQINQYLRSGVNTVMLEGRSDMSVFVKIGVMSGQEFKRVVEKKEFNPGDISEGESLVFEADIEYTLPIFDPLNRVPADVSGKSLFPLLDRLREYLHGSDYDKAMALLLSQTKVWSEQAYGQEAEQLDLMLKQAGAYYRKNNIRYLPPSPESLRLIKGESVVLVYSGIDDSGFSKSKTLGEFLVNSVEKRPVPAMRMVFVGGQWRVWE